MPITNHHWRITGFIFSFAIFFIFSHLSLSQTKSVLNDPVSYYPKKYITHFDLLVGPSLIYPRGNESLKDKRIMKIGYSGGIAFRRNLNANWDLGLNVLYENKGIKAEYEYLNTDYIPPIVEQSLQNIDLNYLTGTFLPRYYFDSGIFISLGPYLGYLLSERIRLSTYQNGVIINKSGTRPDPYLNYKKFDFGISGAVGYLIQINKREIGYIQITYNYGLVLANQPIILEIKNNTCSILFAFHLRTTKSN